MHCIPLIRVAETDNISFRFGLRNVQMYSKRHAVSCHNNNSLIPHLCRVVRAAWDWGVLSLAKAGTKEGIMELVREKRQDTDKNCTHYTQSVHTPWNGMDHITRRSMG